MSQEKGGIFPRKINKSQAKDTGMAMVLICLLLGLFTGRDIFFRIGVAALVINMIFPLFYKYIAVVWLGLSHLLGLVVSKILLTVVFFVLVTPVGLLRRLFGFDSLKLKKFKKDDKSVMLSRKIVFQKSDLEKPF
ncbi:MAG: hypothetical protein JXB45_10680 [Candidatus Krumholzibacteriota bacterium]|nr:hypothetical protein [Candidatus Krumholzibacteriota bacterium]